MLAHELGHAFIYSLLGLPPPDRVSAEFLAFHESAADCAAMIAVLHFDSVVNDLLRTSRGNIYLPNELNRIGELSDTEQLRIASNSLTIADVPDPRTPAVELTQRGPPHDRPAADRRRLRHPGRGVPEIPRRGAIHQPRARRAVSPETSDAPSKVVQAGFDRAYAGRHDAFKAALLDARDYVGRLLAGTWRLLGWDVTFDGVPRRCWTWMSQLTAGAGRDLLIENLAWRGIEVGFRGRRSTYSERLAGASRYADRRW